MNRTASKNDCKLKPIIDILIIFYIAFLFSWWIKYAQCKIISMVLQVIYLTEIVSNHWIKVNIQLFSLQWYSICNMEHKKKFLKKYLWTRLSHSRKYDLQHWYISMLYNLFPKEKRTRGKGQNYIIIFLALRLIGQYVMLNLVSYFMLNK